MARSKYARCVYTLYRKTLPSATILAGYAYHQWIETLKSSFGNRTWKRNDRDRLKLSETRQQREKVIRFEWFPIAPVKTARLLAQILMPISLNHLSFTDARIPPMH